MKILKKTINTISLLLLCYTTFSQNLVPNPSFEDTLGCPNGYPDLNTKCQYWTSFRVTPDYMNNCSSVCGYDNQFGYQQPHSGQAYTGLITYQKTYPNSRENLGVQLTAPLVIGTEYYISFYVSPAWNNLLTNIATNKMGALVTTAPYSDPSNVFPLSNTCTVYSDTIVKDTSSWYKIFGSFVADSAYQYLVIGNFFDDTTIDTINFPYQVVPQVAYYYLDDVCLSTDSIYAQTWAEISTGEIANTEPLNDIKIQPNPISHDFIVKTNNPIQKVEIINYLGQSVFSSTIENEMEAKLLSDDIKNGFYFLRVKTTNGLYDTKIIINH